MCAKMPNVIESVGDQGQRVEQGFEWPDDSAKDRLSRQTRCRRTRLRKATRSLSLRVSRTG